MIIYLENQKYGFKIKKNNTECAFPEFPIYNLNQYLKEKMWKF